MKIDLLKPHDILLYRGSGVTSLLIQWGSKSVYSHIAVVVDPNIYLGIESNTGHHAGVRAMDLRKCDATRVDAFRIKPEFTFDGKKVISFLVNCLGSDYDWLGVSSLALMKGLSFLTGFKKFQNYNAFQKEKDYFCSELVYQAFQEGGLDIVPQIDQADITSPGDIAGSERLKKVG